MLAFSGGRDSVLLAEILHAAGFAKLVLVHVDHGLRPESLEDARWAQEFASVRGIEFEHERIDVAALAAERGVGLEEAGRAARYAFFARVARKRGCHRVVLGHHADDQVETFLFRLLRGAGSGGLGAMAVESERVEDEIVLKLLRPMLSVWRADIDAAIEERKLAYREDASNTDPTWARNRIRHFLPDLERVMQRPVRRALWRTAEVLRAEAEWLEESERAVGPLSPTLEVHQLRAMPLALQRRRVARWLQFHQVPEVGFDLIEKVLALAFQRNPAKLNLPGGRHVRRRAGIIFCE